MSAESTDQGHGHSPAAWTAVTVMLIAFTLGTFAFWFDQAWLVWASAGLLAAGALLGWIMKKAGYGVNGAKSDPKGH
ncbi:hypothetical protein IWX78_001027 [Mycetocola sp. CAN_C7]|uniref:DUF6704 family protein n=1 Tax=Mycetocola sp. CAN_C7 TaxID=2787724 RepID=UPI0018CB525B